METKAIQMKGGTRLGQENPTWLKQKNDKFVCAAAFVTCATGLTLAVKGHVQLAFGWGKKE